jgi:hypothetical protein
LFKEDISLIEEEYSAPASNDIEDWRQTRFQSGWIQIEVSRTSL